MKEIADDKLNVALNIKSANHRVGNIVFFPTMFSNGFFFKGPAKSPMCGKGLNVNSE